MFLRYILPAAAGLLIVAFACLLPERFLRLLFRLGGNAALACALLLLINAFTSLDLPLNALTLTVGSLLGVPGMAALGVIATL